MRAANPNWQWGVQEHLQAAQLDVLRLLLWAKTKDGAKGRKRPEPTPRPGLEDTKAGRAAGFQVLPLDELKRKLSLPRR